MRVNAHGAPTLRDNLIYENTAEGIKVSKAGGGLFTQNVRSRTAGPGRAGPDKGMCGGGPTVRSGSFSALAGIVIDRPPLQ